MSRMSSRKLSAADVDDIFARNLQSYLGGVSRVISGKPQYLDHMVDFGLEVDLATAVYGIDLLYAYFFVSKSVLHRYIVPARVDRLNRFFSKLHLVDRVYTSNHYPTDVEKFCGPGTAYTEFMKETPAKKFDEIYKRIIQQQSSGRQRANNITLLMLCCMLLEAKKSLSLLLTWSKFKQTFNKLYSECKDEAAKKSFNKLVGDIREKRTRKGKSRLFWNRILDFKHGIYFLYGDLVYQVRRYMSDHPFYKILADHWVKKCVNDPGDNLSISYSEKGDVEFEISPFFGIDFLSGKVALSLAKSVCFVFGRDLFGNYQIIVNRGLMVQLGLSAGTSDLFKAIAQIEASLNLAYDSVKGFNIKLSGCDAVQRTINFLYLFFSNQAAKFKVHRKEIFSVYQKEGSVGINVGVQIGKKLGKDYIESFQSAVNSRVRSAPEPIPALVDSAVSRIEAPSLGLSVGLKASAARMKFMEFNSEYQLESVEHGVKLNLNLDADCQFNVFFIPRSIKISGAYHASVCNKIVNKQDGSVLFFRYATIQCRFLNRSFKPYASLGLVFPQYKSLEARRNQSPTEQKIIERLKKLLKYAKEKDIFGICAIKKSRSERYVIEYVYRISKESRENELGHSGSVKFLKFGFHRLFNTEYSDYQSVDVAEAKLEVPNVSIYRLG